MRHETINNKKMMKEFRFTRARLSHAQSVVTSLSILDVLSPKWYFIATMNALFKVLKSPLPTCRHTTWAEFCEGA